MDDRREAAVSGRFYPRDADSLRNFLNRVLISDTPSKKVSAIFVPHAGYIYSGKSAAEVYRQIEVPDRVIILCPNHTGRGRRLSIWPSGVWETPMGEVPVDAEIASELLGLLKEKPDTDAHLLEHAIEVHLPFLKWKNPNVKIVPIVLGTLQLQRVLEVADAIASYKDALVVSSTDMSHYISAKEAKKMDGLALTRIEAVDAEGLYNVVMEKDISMCGYLPTTCLLRVAEDWGLRRGEIVSYTHSGEVTGDDSSVVSYASGWLI